MPASKPWLSTQALPALQRTLTYRLHQLHKLTDRDSQAAHLADTGLPLGEARCLSAIGAFEPLSVKDLARMANLDKGQASRAAQSLVEQGLVSKQASAADGRGVVLQLTGPGQAVNQRVMCVVERRNQDIFGCLSPAEQAQFSALFDRVIAHVRGASGGPITPMVAVVGRVPPAASQRMPAHPSTSGQNDSADVFITPLEEDTP